MIEKCVLPVFKSRGPSRVELVGSGFFYDVAGRCFFVTAAHVAEKLSKEQPVLLGNKSFHSVHLPFVRTLGGEEDKLDIAVAGLNREHVMEAFGEDYLPFTH